MSHIGGGSFSGDGTPPIVVSAYAQDSFTVVVRFSEAMSSIGLTTVGNYTIPGLTISSVVADADRKSVALITSKMTDGQSYTVTVNTSLTDTVGNGLTLNTATFTAPTVAADLDDDEDCPDENEAFKKLVTHIPTIYKPTVNPVVKGLLIALAQGDCVVRDQISEFKDQLFVVSADTEYLNRLGGNVGVERPSGIGMRDDDYRDLIPVMSYMPKQIRQGIQELLRIWYGDLAVHAHLETPVEFPVAVNNTTATFTTETGTYSVTFESADFENPLFPTADEVALAFNKKVGTDAIRAMATYCTFDPQDQKTVTFRTNTVGSAGWIKIETCTYGSTTGLTGKATINSQSHPAVVYEVKSREIIVVMPSSPTIVQRDREGAWYLNEDESGTLDSGYLFDPNAKFSVSGVTAPTTEAITIGQIKTTLAATVPTTWPDATGYFVIDFGKSTQEGSIKFLAKPNAAGIVIDPTYVWKFTHASGSTLNYIRKLGAPTIATDNTTVAAYATGVAIAREALKDLIKRVAASGLTIRFVVHSPGYRFSNPALDTNAVV